jgi:DNA-binding response OmpR family regulator
MSLEHPNILFVGAVERGQVLQAKVEAMGWQVTLPMDRLEALAMYIFYYPDIVVIDTVGQCHMGTEVYFHLRSAQAKPMLILAREDHLDRWNVPYDSAVRVLPHTLPDDELIAMIEELVLWSKAVG